LVFIVWTKYGKKILLELTFVKISKTIKELWKEKHKLALPCVFIKIKIENKGEKLPTEMFSNND
jgi:hypothetical protein